MLKQTLLFVFVLILFFSCSRNDKIIDEAEKLDVHVAINRLDKKMFGFSSLSEAATFLQEHPDFVTKYLELEYPVTDSALVKKFYSFYSNAQLKEFYLEADSEFGEFTEIKAGLEKMFRYVKYFYPSFKVPALNTVVTGYSGPDLVVSDEAVILSYDYFLGEKARYKPEMHQYFLERYRKETVVPMIALALSQKFNNADMQDETMLASMIYYGKAHYFVERVLPELSDTLNIMYKGKELEDVKRNIDIIWGHFIEKKLLYEKSRFLVEKYCGERPKVLEIGDKCPGRIGRWLGWQIVRSYMEENPNVTLSELMMEKDAHKIFKLSRYKPGK